MNKRLTFFTLALISLSMNSFSEEIQEIIVLEKKLSSLSEWSNNQSISSINEDELVQLDAQHPKQILRLKISRTGYLLKTVSKPCSSTNVKLLTK